MSKLDENLDELAKLAAFGQAVLDSVKESGLIKQKRRKRVAAKKSRRGKPRKAVTAASAAGKKKTVIPRGEIPKEE